MAKKASIQYVCANCGAVYGRWTGKCSNCGEWNTISEQIDVTSTLVSGGRRLQAEKISDVDTTESAGRIPTHISDVDQVLGGGFVKASVNLIAGQPGIGKSTLLLQVAASVGSKHEVLYVSGEESVAQVKLRSNRLKTNAARLSIVTTNSADDIATTIASGVYDLVIVDSIQTISVGAIASAAGSVSQITNSTQLLTLAAKNSKTALVLVGHVTKEGAIAGPKVLEHLVDVVLHLEGDRYGGFKLLRAIKNRFGSTNEAGIFEMTETGLIPVANPSAALLAERQMSDGSIVMATMEGTRPILVEVQALVSPTSFGYPKRAASGIDINRVTLLIAMLSRRTKLNLSEMDVYVNIVGGIRITEPAADLAVCMAIASAAKGMMLKKNVVVFGEVGLSGEVRHVPMIDRRLSEAQKLGFEGALGPKTTKKTVFLTSVSTVREALNTFLEKD